MAVNMGAFGAAPSSSTANTGTSNQFNLGLGSLTPSGGTSTGTGFGTTTNTGFGAPATGTNTNNTGFGTPTGTNSGFGAQAMTSGGAQNQPLYTSLGAPGQWNVGATPFGAPAFTRGNEYVVSDEIFWNPHTPMGMDLQNIVRQVQSSGGQAGLTLTPYTFLDNKATIQQVLDEIKNSGVNFVALDPYLFGDNRFTPEQGIEWTRQAVEALKNIGVDPRVVTQSFYHTGMDPDVVRRYNAALAAIPGISEATLFGFEDADWGPGYANLENPYGYETPQAPANLTPAQAQRYLQLTGSDQGLYSALASAYGSPGSVAEDAAAVRNVMAQNNITVQDIARLMNVPASEISTWLDTNAPLAMPGAPTTPTTPTTPVEPRRPRASADMAGPTDIVGTLENIITGGNAPDVNVPANQPTAADITVPDTITAPTTPTTPAAPVTTAAPDLVTTLEDIVTGGAAEPITPTTPATPTTPVAPPAPDLVTTLEDIVTGNVAAPPPSAAAPSTVPLANKPVTPPAAPVAQPKSPVAPLAPAPVAGKKELSPKVKAALEKSSLAKKELPIPKSKADSAKEAKKSSVQSGIINALESQGVTGKPASDIASLVMSGGGASPSKSALLNALTGGKASSKASPAQLQQVNKIAKALGIG